MAKSMIDRLNQKSEVTALSHAVENKMPTVPEVEIYEDITDIGRDITIRDVSEEAEAGKIPVRSEENFIEHEEIRFTNPNFPLPHGMRIRSLRQTGIIAVGNNYVDIGVGLVTGTCLLGAQVKCLAIAGIAPSYWHACYYFHSVNYQMITMVDMLDVEGAGWQRSFDAHAASAECPAGGGSLSIRVYLDINAVRDAEYDVVVYILDFIDCSTAS